MKTMDKADLKTAKIQFAACIFVKNGNPGCFQIGGDPRKDKKEEPQISHIETGKTPKANEVDKDKIGCDKNGLY